MDIWKINFLKLITTVHKCILKNCKRAIQKVKKNLGNHMTFLKKLCNTKKGNKFHS